MNRELNGGAEGDRTPDLRIANYTAGKTLSICLFKSCSHRRKSRVFTFFPIPYHRVCVVSWFFWSRIGHLEFVGKTLIEIPILVVLGTSNSPLLTAAVYATLPEII